NPRGFHLTNVLLHATNLVLVFALALQILQACLPPMVETHHLPETPLGATGDPEAGVDRGLARSNCVSAAVVALAFGVHPLRVEAVAWISERRELLCTLFLLCSVIAYVRSCRTADAGRSRASRSFYCMALICFALSLLSKAMGMALPIVLL